MVPNGLDARTLRLQYRDYTPAAPPVPTVPFRCLPDVSRCSGSKTATKVHHELKV